MATGDEILAWRKAAEETVEPLTECPDDGWTLEKTDEGLHCKFCGRVY